MATKEIKTRIALRTGDYAYWTTGAGKDIELYKGEVCICTVAVADNQATTAPTVLFKVANASGQKFADLNWVSGLAADVYAWAKKANPDWTDFPALPLTVVDEGTGKFVTGFTYADNKLTITRDDAVNALTTTDDDVVVLTVDKNKGDVTIDAKHAEKGVVYNGGQAANSINAFGQEITIKVPKLGIDKYGHTNSAEDIEYKISLPTPDAAVNTVTTVAKGNGIEVEDTATDGNHNYVVSHANTSDIANVVAADRTYVKSLTFDDFGHVIAVSTGAETVVDTNTAHTHSAGDGLKKTGDGGIDGDVKYELNVAMKLEDGDIVIYDKDNNNEVARLDAAELLEDSYLNDVEIVDNELQFTWKMDDGTTKTDSVDLKHLVDVYTGTPNDYIAVSVDNYEISAVLKKVDTAIIDDGAITYDKLDEDLQSNADYVDSIQQFIGTGANPNVMVTYHDGALFLQGEVYNRNDDQYGSDDEYRVATRGDIDYEIVGLAGEGNTTTVKALADRVKGLEDAKHISNIEADTGLKVVAGTDGANNKVAIDETVVFVLDCNW